MFVTGAERRRYLMLQLHGTKRLDEVWPYLKDHNVFNQGFQITFEFPNGRTVSCVSHQYSMGGEEGLWEIAEVSKKGDVYTVNLEDGHLTTRALVENLIEIKERELV